MRKQHRFRSLIYYLPLAPFFCKKENLYQVPEDAFTWQMLYAAALIGAGAALGCVARYLSLKS